MKTFADNVVEWWGEEGRRWLHDLPDQIERVAAKHGLRDIRAVSALSFNWVGYAKRTDGEPVVLKICFPRDEARDEMTALRAFGGRGSVDLLAADPEERLMILERLDPGTTLAEIDDAQATDVAAKLAVELHKATPDPELRTLYDWCRALRVGCRLPGIDNAKMRLKKIESTVQREVLLHGDLHQYNILRATRAPWVSIDPKGIVGDPAFEAAMFLHNELEEDFVGQLMRRAAVFGEALQCGSGRVLEWTFLQSMLSACWAVENGSEPTADLAHAAAVQRALDA